MTRDRLTTFLPRLILGLALGATSSSRAAPGESHGQKAEVLQERVELFRKGKYREADIQLENAIRLDRHMLTLTTSWRNVT